MRLQHKVAIITGAGSGIGLATAQRFAAEGARVVVADIRDATAQMNAIRARGGDARYVAVDVSREAEVQQLVAQTLEAYGRLDILVNNAGIEIPRKVTDMTEAEWDRLMSVNLKGVFLCAKWAIPAMRRGGGGVIVNVASELGLVGGTEIAAYAASKGGVVQLTKAMAIDHAADGIRVNCVCPGPVLTPLIEATIQAAADPEAERRQIIADTLLKRFARPEEIANVILFLASDESSYMTGSIVVADGGGTA